MVGDIRTSRKSLPAIGGWSWETKSKAREEETWFNDLLNGEFLKTRLERVIPVNVLFQIVSPLGAVREY